MTGGDIPIGDFTYPVTSDLSGKQFWAVYLNSTTLAVCPTGNYACLGILQDNPNATSTGVNKTTVGTVRELGHSKAWIYYAAGTVVAGSPLRVSTTTPGKLELGTVATDVIVAIACEAASTTADSIIEVALTARTAQGATARSGQMVFSVPMVNLGTSGAHNAVASIPTGFTGTITGMYAIPTVIATTSGATVLSMIVNSTAVTGMTCTCSNAGLKTLGTVMASAGSVSGGTGAFSTPATDTLTIVSTPSVTFAGETTSMLEIHVVYN